jgi:peptide chain release factor 2
MSSGGIFDRPALRTAIQAIEAEMSAPTFWDVQTTAQQRLRALKHAKRTLEPLDQAQHMCADLQELVAMVEVDDVTSIQQLADDCTQLERIIGDLEFQQLFSGEHDARDAILSVNAGAGGTESCDWAAMLTRMYTRWAEQQGCTALAVDVLPGEEAGTKSATYIIRGDHVYGKLRAEVGVHRLVRISPFDANSRRHTSFVSVDVVPEFDEEIVIEIRPEDVRVDTYRAGGAGGQHVNKTDSAVRITHTPTNVVVQCQNERSQLQNRQTAMKMLQGKLYAIEQQKKDEALAKEHAGKQKIEWGSQIRSYVLHPYHMVKDHRTDLETGNTTAVLDGDINQFIEAFLRWQAAQHA